MALDAGTAGVIGALGGSAITSAVALSARFLDRKDREAAYTSEDQLRHEAQRREDDRSYIDERKQLYYEWAEVANSQYRRHLDAWLERDTIPSDGPTDKLLTEIRGGLVELFAVTERTQLLAPGHVRRATSQYLNDVYLPIYNFGYGRVENWEDAATSMSQGMEGVLAAFRADLGVAEPLQLDAGART